MALIYTPETQTLDGMPSFKLLNVDDKYYKADELKGDKGTLVIFICNHCPYVKKMLGTFTETLTKVKEAGVSVVCINSNDASVYPEDSFENMQKFAEENKFSFPYLYDEEQAAAKAYGAVCTPDFFGFNAEGSLEFRGCFDELLDAMETMANTGKAPEKQTPSMGCSIKWRESVL